MLMTTSYNYLRALPLVAVTALVMYGSLQCLYRKENNHNQEEVPQTPIIFAPPRGINQTTLEADIRQCIDIPASVNLTNLMLNVIDIPTMIRKHEMNKRKSIKSGMKPLLIIIDPGLFFDVKPVNISEQKASNKSSLSNIICAFNQNTLRFSLRSDNSGSDNIYVYRQDLMVFISWMHRLEQNFKIPIEIIAYSETLRLNELLFHINLIQIYYNSVALSNTNSDEWFKFIAAITSRPHSKLYQEIDNLFPFRDYQFVLVVDDKQEPENLDSNDNVIGFNAPKFTMAGLNQNMELVQDKGDIFLLSLKEFIKNIVANERYRLFIKQLVENHHIPFWNTLSEDGEITKTRIVPQENYWH